MFNCQLNKHENIFEKVNGSISVIIFDCYTYFSPRLSMLINIHPMLLFFTTHTFIRSYIVECYTLNQDIVCYRVHLTQGSYIANLHIATLWSANQ